MKQRNSWRRTIGILAALCALLSPLVVGAAPATAVGLWNCPFGGPSVPIDPNYVAYVKLFSLVSSTSTFFVADTRTVINATDSPATATFTSQRSQTVAITVSVGTSADLLDFLHANVSVSVQQSVTTSIGVSVTGQVPPHSQLLGEYGVQGFAVTYDVTTYQILAHVSCKSVGVQRFNTNAPTNVQGWRLRVP